MPFVLTITGKEARIIECEQTYMLNTQEAAHSLAAVLGVSLNDNVTKPTTRKRRQVYDWTTSTLFDSVSAAAKSIGVTPAAVFKSLNEPLKHPVVKGHRFAWKDLVDRFNAEQQQAGSNNV